MKKFFSLLGALTCAATLSLSFVGCTANKPAKSDDLFTYDPTESQNEWIITGIEKENGDGILEIPETIDGKPVTEIYSLDYRPNDEETSLHFTEIERLLIPKSVKLLSSYVCRDMVGLQEVVFSEDSQIEDLEGTFQGCKNLHNVDLPTFLKQIYAETFEGCEALTSITLPKAVENVSAAAFKNSGIAELTVDLENPYFSAVDNVLYNKEITELIYYPAKKAEETFIVLDGVTEISGEAFYNCKALKSIDLNKVEGVRRMAFAGCENLAEITAEKLKYADEYVFNDTSWYKNYQGGEIYLDKVLLSYTKFAFELNLSGYVYIAPYAFQGHKDLHRIIFDNELTTIGDGAFMDCVNLYQIIFDSRSTMVFIGQNVFENNATNRFFKVYEPLYNNYIENTFWQIYKDNIKTFS